MGERGAVVEMACYRPAEARADDDGVRWLALVLAEMMRTGLALLAKRYPEARGGGKCAHCGHRQ